MTLVSSGESMPMPIIMVDHTKPVLLLACLAQSSCGVQTYPDEESPWLMPVPTGSGAQAPRQALPSPPVSCRRTG